MHKTAQRFDNLRYNNLPPNVQCCINSPPFAGYDYWCVKLGFDKLKDNFRYFHIELLLNASLASWGLIEVEKCRQMA